MTTRAPTTSNTPTTMTSAQSLWVIQGEITFGVGDECYTLRAGDRLMLPKGTVHTAYTGVEGCLYFIGQKAG